MTNPAMNDLMIKARAENECEEASHARETSPNPREGSRDCGETPRNTDELCKLYSSLGGPAAVGRIVGVSTEYASSWKRRGSIPIEHWPALIMSAAGKAIGLTEARLLHVHTGVSILTPAPVAPRVAEQDDDSKVRWTAEDPNLIFNTQPATRVYVNPYNQVVISQHAAEYGDDDPFVFFQPENIPRLIEALLRVTEEG